MEKYTDPIFRLIMVFGTIITSFFIVTWLPFFITLLWTMYYFVDTWLDEEDGEEKMDPVVSMINYSLVQQDLKILQERVNELSKLIEESE